MTDAATTEATIEESTSEGDGPKQLREALKAEKAKNTKLTKQLMGTAYEEAGLDPETGLGKAIAKEYKGDPTVEALLVFAKDEYGYEKATAPDNPQQAKIVEATEQLDQVQATSVSTVPLNDAEALQTAEVNKDYRTAGKIKAGQLRDLMKG